MERSSASLSSCADRNSMVWGLLEVDVACLKKPMLRRPTATKVLVAASSSMEDVTTCGGGAAGVGTPPCPNNDGTHHRIRYPLEIGHSILLLQCRHHVLCTTPCARLRPHHHWPGAPLYPRRAHSCGFHKILTGGELVVHCFYGQEAWGVIQIAAKPLTFYTMWKND